MGREFGRGTVPSQIRRGTRVVAVDVRFVSERRSIRSTAVAGSYWTNQFHEGRLQGRDVVGGFRRDAGRESGAGGVVGPDRRTFDISTLFVSEER